jgi:hypothetical protein
VIRRVGPSSVNVIASGKSGIIAPKEAEKSSFKNWLLIPPLELSGFSKDTETPEFFAIASTETRSPK